MFRAPRYLERVNLISYRSTQDIRLPANGQFQVKDGLFFDVRDRDVRFDWSNAYFLVEYELQVKANGNFVAADTASPPVNGSFSLIKSLTIESATAKLYEANNINKIIFIKKLDTFSDDYARGVAKDEFWYLDNDNTTVTGAAATSLGIRARARASFAG